MPGQMPGYLIPMHGPLHRTDQDKHASQQQDHPSSRGGPGCLRRHDPDERKQGTDQQQDMGFALDRAIGNIGRDPDEEVREAAADLFEIARRHDRSHDKGDRGNAQRHRNAMCENTTQTEPEDHVDKDFHRYRPDWSVERQPTFKPPGRREEEVEHEVVSVVVLVDLRVPEHAETGELQHRDDDQGHEVQRIQAR